MVVHPFLLSIFPIIFLFFQNDGIDPEEIVLPLLIVLIFTFVIWIVLGFVLKNRIKSGFIVSLGLVIFFSYGHIYILLDAFQPNLSHFILIIPFIGLFGLGSYYFIKTKNHLDNATKIVNGVAVVLIILPLLGGGEYFMTLSSSTNELENVPQKNVFQSTEPNEFPDVYYIILDAYAGPESLETLSDYDNSDFLNFLTEKGFYISSNSFSNYPTTKLSIPSTLNMKYLHYLIDESEGSKNIITELHEISRDNAVIKNFKSKGYTIYVIEAGATYTKHMKNVDFRLCVIKDLAVTDFHTMLIRTTALNPIQGYIFSSGHRDKILCGFSELSEMANRNDSPKFVFAHLMIPHQPYIFGPNGEPLVSKILTLENEVKPDNLHLYLGQLQFANIKMKEILEKLTAIENPPIIIIQSDHGGRVLEHENKYEAQLNRLNNFKAYYFPGEGRNIEFETTTPVNSFRVLFNILFDDEYELLEDRMYEVKQINHVPVKVRDVTDILINNNSEN